MFNPVDMKAAYQLYDELDYVKKSVFHYHGDPWNPIAVNAVIQRIANLYNESLTELFETIQQLDPSLKIPRWYITYQGKLFVFLQLEDLTAIPIDSYQEYLSCVSEIKELFNYDELLKKDKLDQWGDRLKERLRSYQKPSAFN